MHGMCTDVGGLGRIKINVAPSGKSCKLKKFNINTNITGLFSVT